MSVISGRNFGLLGAAVGLAGCVGGTGVFPGTGADVNQMGPTECTPTGSITPYQVNIGGRNYYVQALTDQSENVVVTGSTTGEQFRAVVSNPRGILPKFTVDVDGVRPPIEVQRQYTLVVARVAAEAVRAGLPCRRLTQGTNIGITPSLPYQFG